HAAAASDEDALVGAIHIHAAGLLAGGEGPGFEHFQRLGIEFEQGVAVLHVEEDVASVVGGGVLGAAAEILDGADGCAGFGVDRGHLLAAAVDGEDAAGLAVVEDSVGVVAYRHFAENG